MTDAEWLACTDPHKMMGHLRDKMSDRKLRLFACACCRQVWHLLSDELSRKAVDVAEKFSDGAISNEEAIDISARSSSGVCRRRAIEGDAMSSNIQDIPPLLHDARFSDCQWDQHLRTLQLSFRCLRRNVDGTPMEERTVDLTLGGVERVVAFYSPASVTVKPSEFKPGSRIALADLENWSHGAIEAHLAINSLQAEFLEATACVRESLVGDLTNHPSESPLRIHISFEPHNYGPEGTTTGIAIDCDSLEPFTNGVPLDMETWEAPVRGVVDGLAKSLVGKGSGRGRRTRTCSGRHLHSGRAAGPARLVLPTSIGTSIPAPADNRSCRIAQAD